VLDLDGNGISVTARADGGGVLLDVDDDGYAEEMDWLNPRARHSGARSCNGDGEISGGHEMLATSRVDMAVRGLQCARRDRCGWRRQDHERSIPAFDHLQIWQDINHDGKGAGLTSSARWLNVASAS